MFLFGTVPATENSEERPAPLQSRFARPASSPRRAGWSSPASHASCAAAAFDIRFIIAHRPVNETAMRCFQIAALSDARAETLVFTLAQPSKPQGWGRDQKHNMRHPLHNRRAPAVKGARQSSPTAAQRQPPSAAGVPRQGAFLRMAGWSVATGNRRHRSPCWRAGSPAPATTSNLRRHWRRYCGSASPILQAGVPTGQVTPVPPIPQ